VAYKKVFKQIIEEEKMDFKFVCKIYDKIEKTTKRKEMTTYLVELLKSTPADIIDKIIYLTQGKLYPDWTGEPELGMAEKLAIKAISLATGIKENEIEEDAKKSGDLGLAAEKAIARKVQSTLFMTPLTVEEVYNTFFKIAHATGEGSTNFKIRALAGLLANATGLETRYIVRIVTGHLRLGIADMTILDALAHLGGSISYRDLLERAYNLTSDLGFVARLLKEKGIDAIKEVKVALGRPIRMMLAQRLATPEEILEKLGGLGWCEFKLDGERTQCHKEKDKVTLFSRRLENITKMYPDVVNAVLEMFKEDDVVIEGEIVPIDPNSGEILPFQELMHRRRKYDIETMMQKISTRLYLFDLLYLNGEDFTNKPFKERAEKLRFIVHNNENIVAVPYLLTNDPENLFEFFQKALNMGSEGLVIKSISQDAIYRAGARSWLWIKLKESYQSKMVEPVDLVIVGAFYGKGRRKGTYGALLTAVYNPETDTFETICKVGSGFTDDMLERLPKMLEKFKIQHKSPRVVSNVDADVWFEPAIVIEVIGDEITLSPVHLAAFNKIRKNAGLAIRFPRFTGRWRDDKKPEDATTVEEILEMYQQQLKKVEE